MVDLDFTSKERNKQILALIESGTVKLSRAAFLKARSQVTRVASVEDIENMNLFVQSVGGDLIP